MLGDSDLPIGRCHGDDAVRRAEVDADTHGNSSLPIIVAMTTRRLLG
jgi:hypothetical protein